MPGRIIKIENRTRTCECGNTKTSNSEACDRCKHLDGGTSHEYRVIAALRDNGNSTISELAAALEMGDDNGKRSLLRTLQRFIKTGRVRRYWREPDQTPIDRSNLDGPVSRILAHSFAGSWVYALDGRTTDGR